MGDVGEKPLREVSGSLVKGEIQGEPEFILPTGKLSIHRMY